MAGSSARRNGLVAFSAAMVVGTVGCVLVPRRTHHLEPLGDRRVVRQRLVRVAGVGERVLVAAVDVGIVRQGGAQGLQRAPHGGGVALEQAPATHGEQRVGGEGDALFGHVVAAAGRRCGRVSTSRRTLMGPSSNSSPSAMVRSRPLMRSASPFGPITVAEPFTASSAWTWSAWWCVMRTVVNVQPVSLQRLLDRAQPPARRREWSRHPYGPAPHSCPTGTG